MSKSNICSIRKRGVSQWTKSIFWLGNHIFYKHYPKKATVCERSKRSK